MGYYHLGPGWELVRARAALSVILELEGTASLTAADPCKPAPAEASPRRTDPPHLRGPEQSVSGHPVRCSQTRPTQPRWAVSTEPAGTEPAPSGTLLRAVSRCCLSL